MSAVVERLSVAEYLARERAAETKHEYIDGETIEMTGGSEAHNLVAVNLILRLGILLADRSERIYSGDMRVTCPDGLVTYPDVIVVRDPPRFADERRDTLLNPSIVVEVLSPSTERYDRGRKFEQYRSIPSLGEYVLAAQDRMFVERFVRADADVWTLTTVSDPEAAVQFSTLGVSVPLRQIYAKVDFATADADQPT